VLLPSEVAVRYLDKGYKVIAITDHTDYSTIRINITCILNFCRHWPKDTGINVLPGIELTHLPLKQFKPLAKLARKEGIKVIVAHGETLVEPVIKGTNRAALNEDIDILAHPGLISDEDVKLAAKKGVFLEVTSRHGHDTTNCHVVEAARKFGAKIIINSDSHSPEDIIPTGELIEVGIRAGLSREEVDRVFEDTATFIKKASGK
jgi:histidinol phosphatase-like PHP family hydrolase